MDLASGTTLASASTVAIVALACAVVTLGILLAISRTQLRHARATVSRLESGKARRGRAVHAAESVVRGVVGTAVRVRQEGVGGMLRSSIEELTGFALADKQAIDRVIGADGTVTILFSDIEDSTRLNERLGDKDWVELLDAHDALVRKLVAKAGGHVVKSQGDGFMLAFGAPVDAIAVAISIQQALAVSRRKALRRTPIKVRVGMHAGRVVHRDGDYFGLNVAMAARVAGHALGGEILATDGVREAVPDQEFTLREGAADLKGIPGQHRLWAVDWTPEDPGE